MFTTAKLPLPGEPGFMAVTDLIICKSAAGYYIGDLYWDHQMGGYLPYSRESACYWATEKEAADALESGHYPIKF